MEAGGCSLLMDIKEEITRGIKAENKRQGVAIASDITATVWCQVGLSIEEGGNEDRQTVP